MCFSKSSALSARRWLVDFPGWQKSGRCTLLLCRIRGRWSFHPWSTRWRGQPVGSATPTHRGWYGLVAHSPKLSYLTRWSRKKQYEASASLAAPLPPAGMCRWLPVTGERSAIQRFSPSGHLSLGHLRWEGTPPLLMCRWLLLWLPCFGLHGENRHPVTERLERCVELWSKLKAIWRRFTKLGQATRSDEDPEKAIQTTLNKKACISDKTLGNYAPLFHPTPC